MSHESLAMAMSVQAALDKCDFPACVDELNFADLADLLDESADSPIVSISPETVEGVGYYCRGAKNASVVVSVQVCTAAKACTKQEKLEELTLFLTQVKAIRDCICKMTDCDLPAGFCLTAPTEFQEVPTDEDLSTLCIRFRETQFSFSASVAPQ